MQRRHYSMKIITILSVICILFLTDCATDKSKQKQKDVAIEDFLSEDDIFDDISKAKKIFYSLPSPLETAMLIKSAGAEYDEQLLNPVTNAGNYTSNRSMALNLGIYTTDLSFASLFDQTQTSIKYMEAARKMAEGLDITDAIDDETIKRLEDNLDNRDVIMDIISETFLNSSSYLKENDRPAVATVVLIGGWIEGLYIATQLVEDNNIQGNKLVDRIAEQKLSFKIVLRMLAENQKDQTGTENKDITELIADINALKNVFDKIKVETSEIKVEPDATTNVATLRSQTKITITPEVFKELRSSVDNLRTNFVQ
ncbi:MAG: hypothetical protein JXB00_14925 [Bacteroidales bacterium]|nr:hypothetical protein [Bacteroidales bacterium]